ncbi:MAG TPA: DUF3226 domain-containing protein [Pirellulales bacterium]|nr:DUF3226 domain-containing protein [Pirellulales bacterium]
MIVPSRRDAVRPTPIARSKLLLVEGLSPANFFEALCRHLGLSDAIEIRSYGGINQLHAYLRAQAAGEDFRRNVQSLLIARDAEDDAVKAKQSVQTAIDALKLHPSVRTQIAIFPNEVAAGMIETLCLSSVADRPHYHCIHDFVVCIEGNGIRLPEGHKRDKHLAQMYLATQEEAQLYPGIAAYRQAWPFDHVAFDRLRAMLANM